MSPSVSHAQTHLISPHSLTEPLHLCRPLRNPPRCYVQTVSFECCSPATHFIPCLSFCLLSCSLAVLTTNFTQCPVITIRSCNPGFFLMFVDSMEKVQSPDRHRHNPWQFWECMLWESSWYLLPMLSRFALCGYALHSSAAFLLLSYQLTLFWSFAISPSVYIFLYLNICFLVMCMSGLVESFAPPSKQSEVGQMPFSPTMPFSSSWRKCFQARWSSSTMLWLCLRFYRGWMYPLLSM